MKLIVNNKQYKRLVEKQNKENNFVNKWGIYIKDNIIKKLEDRNLSESVISLNNLNLKLSKQKFFNLLPIDNLILNIYNERLDETIIELDDSSLYLDETNKIKDVFINITVNNNKNLSESISSSKLAIKLIEIKKWYENNNK